MDLEIRSRWSNQPLSVHKVAVSDHLSGQEVAASFLILTHSSVSASNKIFHFPLYSIKILARVWGILLGG